MPSVTVDRLEERWSPTTIQTAFVFQPPSRKPSSGGISVDFPLLNLGWTFRLSLAPDKSHHLKKGKQINKWIPQAFSFRQHGSTIRWENTSIDAELSLDTLCHTDPQAQHTVPVAEEAVTQFMVTETQAAVPEFTLAGMHEEVGPVEFAVPERHAGASDVSYNNMDGNMTPLAGMKVILADTPSLELPLKTPSTISSLRPNRVWLTVKVSGCPFRNGLFGARFQPVDEAEVQAQLVKQSGNRLLQKSLTTGRLVDVKFMTPSARPASGTTGESLPTYALLSVLEAHVHPSSPMLRESWTDALTRHDNTEAQRAGEILSPKGYEYDELDSDFEDDDDDGDIAVPADQQSESGIGKPNDPLSPFEPVEGASHCGSVDNQLEELFKGSIRKDFDYERTVWIKFVAHRTWLAFLWYCYTGNLEFGKLRSQVEPGGRHLHVTPLEGGPPTCSPKSMYRLADLLSDQDLKARALAAIKERMTEANVVEEIFSVFTSRYPDVRDVQLGVLRQHRGSPMVKKAFLGAIGKYGSMPHVEPVLSAVYDNLMA